MAYSASNELHVVRSEAKPLVGDKIDEFHLGTQKPLYVIKRARPDIDTTVAYLCNLVTKKNNHNWWKLKRVLKWLKQTINDKKIMGKGKTGINEKWIVNSYANHLDMKDQSWGRILMGHGTLKKKLMKQKLNAKSSTETEVISISDILLHNLWLVNLLNAQGYKVK